MIALYLNEHIPAAVARGLKRRGVDVLTTQDAENRGNLIRSNLLLPDKSGACWLPLTAIIWCWQIKGENTAAFFIVQPASIPPVN